MTLPSFRKTYLFGFLVIACLLSLAWYLQTHDGIEPCPLCILQRVALAILGVFFFLGALIPFKKCGRFFISLFAIIFALLGTLIAGRQVWLQHLPASQNSDCGASLEYMLHVLPVHTVLEKVLTGSAECSRIDWQFLNLSLAEWSFICFIGLLMLSILPKRTSKQK